MTLNEFLQKSDVLLTLTNEAGETYRAGKPDYVKPLASKTIMRWKTKGDYTNINPFTYAILHNERKVFSAVYIQPLLPQTETVIELEYHNE